ncbi:MAG: hypothetical protein ACP5D9_07150 [Mariniphaga sp.]
MEKLLVDMMMEAEYVIPLFEASADFQTEIGLRSFQPCSIRCSRTFTPGHEVEIWQ